MGDFQEIQTINRQSTVGFDAGIYVYEMVRHSKLIVVTNFSGRILVFSNLDSPVE
jgi:hypothetical protein